MKKFLLVLSIIVIGLALVACGPETKSYTLAEKEEELVKAFVAFMDTQEGKATIQERGGIVSTSPSDPSWDDIAGDFPVTALDNSDVTLKFGGSTSVESVAMFLSAQFSGLAGNFEPEHNHTGSGDAVLRTQGSQKDGVNALHIAFASRAFTTAELEILADDTYGQLAWDAVVAVVHPSNTVANITAAQLKGIYEADNANPLTTWGQVAGGTGSAEIKAYTRDTSSGTREAFFGIIGFSAANTNNAPLVSGYIQVESNGQMLGDVAGDANAIGYVSLSSITSAVKGLTYEGVAATVANVLNNTYGLKRPFMFVTRY